MTSVRPNPATPAQGRPSPTANAAETFEIPMNRLHPAWYGVVVLCVVAVVAAIVIARRPGTKKTPAADQTVAQVKETKEQVAARREHMEITQKSMARAAESASGTEPPAAAESPEEAPTPKAAAPVSRAAKPTAANAAANKAASKPVSHKQLDALDRMGEDIAGQLK
jgi:cytoskeletal protein RodZ